ncbi:MAG: hypothetical protein II486_04765, partial [Thermoguttaceae bacterium]|nr:hypothetical protein [Thermoguttaceae bacterium]
EQVLVTSGKTNEWIYIPLSEEIGESVYTISWFGGVHVYSLNVSPGKSYIYHKTNLGWMVAVN